MKKLIVINERYLQLLSGFGEWLGVLGYAPGTQYYAPLHVREFLHYLESRGIRNLLLVSAEVINMYFDNLSKRTNQRRNGSISPAHINKHRQALRSFSPLPVAVQ